MASLPRHPLRDGVVLPRQVLSGVRQFRAMTVHLLRAVVLRSHARDGMGRVRALLWGLLPNVRIARGVRIGRGCRLEVSSEGFIGIGEQTYVAEGVVLAVAGAGRLVIGPRVMLAHGVTVSAVERVEIGEGTLVAEYVSIRDHDHDVSNEMATSGLVAAAVVVGAGCWLGAKSTVLRGATLGPRVVLAANSVARGELDAGWVFAGAPAVKKKPASPAA